MWLTNRSTFSFLLSQQHNAQGLFWGWGSTILQGLISNWGRSPKVFFSKKTIPIRHSNSLAFSAQKNEMHWFVDLEKKWCNLAIRPFTLHFCLAFRRPHIQDSCHLYWISLDSLLWIMYLRNVHQPILKVHFGGSNRNLIWLCVEISSTSLRSLHSQ